MKPLSDTDKLINNSKVIHMIGIGGAGMCPLAEILHSQGHTVTGSDNNPSDPLNRIISLGIPVTLGHKPENVHGADLVIHSAAIMKTNPELQEAERLGIPTLERSYLLGAVTRRYNNCIGVCGTHGKTTATSMITQILIESNCDPSAVIGGKLPKINSYCKIGKSDTLVVESCEYVDTFLKETPDVAVLLNVDSDHMEYFKTMDRLIESFNKFLSMAHTVIVNGDDKNSLKATKGITSDIITFGLDKSNTYYADNISLVNGAFPKFDLYKQGEFLCTVELSVPGEHNILNSLAAAAASINAGAEIGAVKKALKDFKGAGRRFEVLYNKNGITVADDYAHHPTELTVTLSAAKEMNYNRVIAVFQPFTYSRTAMLLDDFAKSLSIADLCVLSPIMGSREINTYNIESRHLAEKIEHCVCLNNFDEIVDYLYSNIKQGDLVISLGCGDIYKATKALIKKLEN
ncbi:MAG: UDP-N-acetylmuramate--L-alanine ligase [Acutalibacteraceae bacterium]|nr:UDP-N-acetylmuramate--L-alanine ligase [Acutalibacteraceae bacterium]